MELFQGLSILVGDFRRGAIPQQRWRPFSGHTLTFFYANAILQQSLLVTVVTFQKRVKRYIDAAESFFINAMCKLFCAAGSEQREKGAGITCLRTTCPAGSLRRQQPL